MALVIDDNANKIVTPSTGLGKAIVDRIKAENGSTTTSTAAPATGTGLVGGVTVGTTGPIDEIVAGNAIAEKGPGSVAGTIDAVTGDTNGDGVVTDDDTTLASAIDDYIAKLSESNRLAEEGAIGNLQAEETIAIQSQEEARAQAEQDYLDNLERINKGVFDETQRGKVSSQRRGIASSQQAEGIAQGIAREGLGLRFKNDQDRTTRLGNITDRISAIKTSTAQKITAAGSERAAADAAAAARGQEIGIQRQFQVEDREDIQEFQISQQAQDFENQLDLIDVNFANVLEKTDVDFRNSFAMAAQQNQWNVDRDAVNNAAALYRLGVGNDNAMKMMGLQQKFDFRMANFNVKQQEKISTLDFERTKELAELSETTQINLMNKGAEISKEQLEYQVFMNYKMEELGGFDTITTPQDLADDVYEKYDDAIFWTEVLSPKWFGIEDKNVNEITKPEIDKAIDAKSGELKDWITAMGGNNATDSESASAWEKVKSFINIGK
jgi:hypothetical protein